MLLREMGLRYLGIGHRRSVRAAYLLEKNRAPKTTSLLTTCEDIYLTTRRTPTDEAGQIERDSRVLMNVFEIAMSADDC